MKNLIIVESPTKAKTIKNFLGSDYEIIASKGHIRDLPKSSFGIKIENDEFVPQYTIERSHSKLVKELKDLAKAAQNVYIATDEDREGEAIGYHIAYAIGKNPKTIPRIVFHEITKKAIIKSLENPRKIDMSSVDAQQARRLLDRIVGYKLSPLISSKIQKGLSAGRVQSSSLKIVVDREREILAFKPQEYHTIEAIFEKEIEALLVEYDGLKIDKLTIDKESMAKEIVDRLKSEKFTISDIETKQRKSKTPPPFMTSTLQQTASTALGYTPKRTMSLAQKLYEGVMTDGGVSGIITYMRTDSLNIAQEAQDRAREIIKKDYGEKYLPKTPKIYTTKSKGAQEAHEAIRPTILEFTPDIAKKYLKEDEWKLYNLIYGRFLASQAEDAIFESQTIIFKSKSSLFKASGRRLIFDGFYKILGSSDEKDKLLPEIKDRENITQDEIKSTKSFTEPPPRYSEAGLIKKLESLGIGRPSTYAPTITLLQSREYINIEKKQLVPSEIAFKVIELLENHFKEIVDSSFTASMEEMLDDVAESKKNWQSVLSEFYHPFIKKIEDGKKDIKSQKIATPTGEMCPSCGAELVERVGRYGKFVACSGYPKCKYIKQEKREELESQEKCEKCGKDMVIKKGRNGEFLACSGYPDCKNTKSLNSKDEKEQPKELETPCPECGKNLVYRKSWKGDFYGCSGYPSCKFITKFLPVDKKCPECNYVMAFRTFRNKDVFECIKCKHKIGANDE